MDNIYERRFQDHILYEEQRRARDLERMYNRVTYQGVPVEGHRGQRRLKTEPDLYNPTPFYSVNQRREAETSQI